MINMIEDVLLPQAACVTMKLSLFTMASVSVKEEDYSYVLIIQVVVM